MNDKYVFHSIGVIHSPHKVTSETPIQPVFADGVKGTVELACEYVDGLKNLEGFSHIYLFFCFHKSQKTCLRLTPYMSDEECGVFATRAPHRPNKLGMSLVRLVKIEHNIIHVKDLDIIDGTPLLDIKPYIRRFDSRDDVKSGWQDAISDDVARKRGLRNFRKPNGT